MDVRAPTVIPIAEIDKDSAVVTTVTTCSPEAYPETEMTWRAVASALATSNGNNRNTSG